MNSHDLARAMQATAEFLLSRPEFETPTDRHTIYLGSYWDNKDSLIAMVKAMGNVKKEYRDSELEVTVDTPVQIWTRINRDKVCRKIQDAKWECEPLLTPEEEAVIG